MSQPVTVSITRHVDPAHEEQMLAWIRAGGALAVRFPGFLGTGWVRPELGSATWHMLYRFSDEESLARWEGSPQRQWWLGAAQGMVGESRVERRTGIEGWFDEPSETDVVDLRPQAAAPPRWKQMIVIWLTFFPLSLAVALLLSRWEMPIVVRVLLSTVALSPVMIYLALPRMTAWLGWWLRGESPPWRRRRA